MLNKPRLLWPDAAKGFAIVLVVLTHLTSKHYSTLDLPIPEVVHLFWLGLADFLTPVRMPLFFAISGFFVGKYLTASWSTAARRRFIPAYYLYILWFVIYSLFFLLDPPLVTSSPSNITEQIIGLLWGYTSLWYLYALPVYFIVCKIFARWPAQALTVAAILSVLSDTTLMPQLGNGASVVGNLVFFMAAAYYPQQISRIEGNARTHFLKMAVIFTVSSSVMSLITYIVSRNSFESNILDLIIGLGDLILGILGIAVGIKIFNLLADKAPLVARFFAYIGARTLPIYVLHLMVLALLNTLLEETSMPFFIAIIYPLVALIIVVWICIGFYYLLLSVRLQWLFKMPDLGRSARKLREASSKVT